MPAVKPPGPPATDLLPIDAPFVLPQLPRKLAFITAKSPKPKGDNPPFGQLEMIFDHWFGADPLPILPHHVVQSAQTASSKHDISKKLRAMAAALLDAADVVDSL